MNCLSHTADICLQAAKSFLPGSLGKEERIIAGAIGGFAAITAIALAILSAPPLALIIVGALSATILTGAILGSRGITYTGLIAGAAFCVAGAALGHLPIGLLITI